MTDDDMKEMDKALKDWNRLEDRARRAVLEEQIRDLEYGQWVERVAWWTGIGMLFLLSLYIWYLS